RALRMGARGMLTKPVKTRDVLDEIFAELMKFVAISSRRVLVIESDEERRDDVAAVVAGGDVGVEAVANGAEALAALERKGADVIVLGTDLGDMSGFDLIDRLENIEMTDTPVVLYAPNELDGPAESQINRLSQTHVFKHVRSPERLFDETALYLHRVVADLP